MVHVRRPTNGGDRAVAVVQNNWITGVAGKQQRFRRHGLWYLDSEEDLQVHEDACFVFAVVRHVAAV
jgi:hypothetical protein